MSRQASFQKIASHRYNANLKNASSRLVRTSLSSIQSSRMDLASFPHISASHPGNVPRSRVSLTHAWPAACRLHSRGWRLMPEARLWLGQSRARKPGRASFDSVCVFYISTLPSPAYGIPFGALTCHTVLCMNVCSVCVWGFWFIIDRGIAQLQPVVASG